MHEDIRSTGLRWSEQRNEIAAALAKAQAEMKAATKDANNPHFKSDYATLYAIREAAVPLLTKQGIAVVQAPYNGDGGDIGVTTELVHSSGQWCSSTLLVKPARQDAQGVGSVISYLRRYSLSAMAGVAPADDDDGEAAVGRGNGVKDAPAMRPANNGRDRPPAARQERVEAPRAPVGDWQLNWPDGLVREFKQTAKGAHECLQAIRGAMGTNGDFLGFGDNGAVYAAIKAKALEEWQETIAEIDDLVHRPALTEAG